MKKAAICLLLLMLASSLVMAEKYSFTTERTVWVMFDGSTQKSENATKTRTFEIKGNYIYDSGINSHGEVFGTDVPFVICAKKQFAIISDKLFGTISIPFSDATKNKVRSLFSTKTEGIISAITVHSGTSPLAETLVMGETFYILSRPLMGYDGFTIETGKRRAM